MFKFSFSLCRDGYEIPSSSSKSENTDEEKLPSISFEMQGGAPYNVFSSILVFETSDESKTELQERSAPPCAQRRAYRNRTHQQLTQNERSSEID
ncbi:hypothetical protein F2Q68_00003440 [Brassica cretica]|uniref:Uncharacterized protein n=1 Tax=Brassica cretica TaxID=69181 RepID=A0A8S9JJV3_BRACR|nr:hypothetical protein F2Q68_00003440 [Brassica cretica]